MSALLARLSLRHPIFQAPMAGVSTPAMAAAVSNGGGLGALGIGAENAAGAQRLIEATRALTGGPFNVNVFCHPPARSQPLLEHAWCARLKPEFAQFGASPPAALREIYTSFLVDSAMLAMLVAQRPAVVSCHFGLPTPAQIDALRAAGIALIATATNVHDARRIQHAGFDAVVAQGFEAGGHRGMFDPNGPDDRLATSALTQALVASLDIPVIAAGGIMDGAGIAAALRLGATAAQLGTAFLDCPESAADVGYRRELRSTAAEHTVMTAVISGRPARCIENRFTRFGLQVNASDIPDYPTAYHAGKALHAAARSHDVYQYGAQWAGEGAAFVRSLPAADLLAALCGELAASSMSAHHPVERLR